ncbi:MAG: transposase, partial [Mucinivorans sp.]
PQGRLLLEDKRLEKLPRKKKIHLAMDKGYEDDTTRQLVKDKGFKPLVPPKSNRKTPWTYNKKSYKRRNKVERLFRRLKSFRRVCTRYEKLDVMYLAFLNLALIFDKLKLC